VNIRPVSIRSICPSISFLNEAIFMSFVSICKDSILCNHLQKHNKDFAEDVFFLSCHLIIGE